MSSESNSCSHMSRAAAAQRLMVSEPIAVMPSRKAIRAQNWVPLSAWGLRSPLSRERDQSKSALGGSPARMRLSQQENQGGVP